MSGVPAKPRFNGNVTWRRICNGGNHSHSLREGGSTAVVTKSSLGWKRHGHYTICNGVTTTKMLTSPSECHMSHFNYTISSFIGSILTLNFCCHCRIKDMYAHTHSSSKTISLTKSQLAHVEKANKDESTPFTAKNLAQLTPTTNNNSLPSGLRLPSPSLRFFDQLGSGVLAQANEATHVDPCAAFI
ncbi:hypothetical protein L2E82_35652 [Cichorium intybus]|uniref:Uncharacterized protein n=1 Tax=Cichorium intybus TaxID=13427 RepID=A0ACB9BPF7_CICIN|nr:hypothetical protein L2E82_35652 [Cichorium intybus]